MWKLLGAEEWKFIQTVLVTWPRWLPPYQKSFISRNRPMKLVSCILDSGLSWFVQIMSLFNARSNLVDLVEWKKWMLLFCLWTLLQLMISKFVVAFNLMSKWSYMSVKCLGHSFGRPWPRLPKFPKWILFLSKPVGSFETKYNLKASRLSGTKIYKWSESHDKDGRHSHLW